jgi:hypothetical protein
MSTALSPIYRGGRWFESGGPTIAVAAMSVILVAHWLKGSFARRDAPSAVGLVVTVSV